MCVSALDVSGAGISMSTKDGRLATVSASDDVASRIEELQFTLGEGPCFEALELGVPILVDDIVRPPRIFAGKWPGFVDGAREAGVSAIFAFPLQLGAIRLGALDLYRDRIGDLSPAQIGAALQAADAAAFALPFIAPSGDVVDEANDRAAFRLEVHQASGMVAAQHETSISEAFARLRAYAFAQQRSINDVAADVVARRLRLPAKDET
ncbi:MAG: GAF and ANTAR domain-containing protein [Actinomycetes bacterium]